MLSAVLRAATILGVALLPLGCGGSDAAPRAAQPAPVAREPACPTVGEEWEVAKLYIEHNATDEDTGVHGLIGGEAWREVCVYDPAGEQIWLVDPRGQLDELAVSDFFFESQEPEHSEYSVDDLLGDFPEGTYVVAGTDHTGIARVGEARFTHAIPQQPVITAPALAEEPETADGALVPSGDLVVRWDPVLETIEAAPVTVSGYEVIVTMEEFDDPHGLSRPVFDVHVGPAATSLTVPADFLQPDTLYELEVLALEESGNQTISVGFFRTPSGVGFLGGEQG